MPIRTRHSRACAALIEAIRDVPGLAVRSLYDLYPDFDIDGDAERAALGPAGLVVWLHPLYWYRVPARLKNRVALVLVRSWANGDCPHALAGKACLWVTTTGGGEEAFSPAGRHGHAFTAFEPAIKQTAQYCEMNWFPPVAVNGAHEVAPEALREAGTRLRSVLEAWTAKAPEARDA